MKQIIIIIVFALSIVQANAQKINGISTNPQNPKDTMFLKWANQYLGSGFTHNPFLNRFNWEDAGGNYIPLNQTYFNLGIIYPPGQPIPMLNPFATGLSADNSIYAQAIKDTFVDFRDFRWKDGWELLWLNLNQTPDGEYLISPNPNGPMPNPQGPIPANAPYFVLYNRYRGLMRIFSNYWSNATTLGRPQKMAVSFEFVNKDNPVNGLLRHAGSYDLALDKETKVTRISAPAYNSPNEFQWGVSDFQLAFDPCICNRTDISTNLGFRFDAMTIMNIDMTSRSISIDQTINDNNFLEEDYLNLSDVKKEDYKSGSRMYGKMERLLNEYNEAQRKYETDLANYNSIDGILKRAAIDVLKQGVASTGSMLGAGVAGSFFTNAPMKNFILKNKTRVGLFSGGLIDLDSNDADAFAKSVTGAAKSILGQGFDFLSTVIDVPDAPRRPTPPVATYTETTYAGTLKISTDRLTQSLLIPGAMPNSYTGNPGIDKVNYPIYNEVLGLFALLETPKLEVKATNLNTVRPFSKTGTNAYSSGLIQKQTTNYQIKLKEPLRYRFNHVVDFDFEKTKLYYSFRIKFKNRRPTLSGIDANTYGTSALQANLFINNQTILEQNLYNVESYGTGNNARYVVVTLPFIEVKNMLNEPLSINNVMDVFLPLVVDISKVKDPSKFANVLNLTLSDYSSIESIDLKLMADMYFLSKGHLDQPLNTVQTFTYQLYQKSDNDNQMPQETNSQLGNVTFLNLNNTILKHQPGNVEFDNIQLSPTTITQYPYHWIGGTDMHIWVENAILKNNVSVATGYRAFIHFIGQAVSNPESAWIPELVLDNIRSEDLYNNDFIYEATDEEVNNFCHQNNTKYKANVALSKTTSNTITNPTNEATDETNVFGFRLYPNPANNETKVLFKLTGSQLSHVGIYTITGELVQSKAINANEIDNNQISLSTEGLSAGVYFVTLTSSNNQSVTQKLIIAK